MNNNCPIFNLKVNTAKRMIDLSIKKIKRNHKKINLIWLEATGCSGNIISLLNATNPDVIYFLRNMVNMTYNNSLMSSEGENAFQRFLDTLDTEFILIVEGAVSTKDKGRYTIIARHQGQLVSAMDAVRMVGKKAKYIVSVGTCASFGGPSAASPNPSDSISVSEFLKKDIIKVPGCPSHPDWVIGTLAHLIAFGP
jgi:hydrogenase small subunit